MKEERRVTSLSFDYGLEQGDTFRDVDLSTEQDSHPQI